MNLQLKNKMTNILSSICMISTPKQYKLDKIKEIVNDNKLTESVENETAEKIKEAKSPDDLINILKEVQSEEKHNVNLQKIPELLISLLKKLKKIKKI